MSLERKMRRYQAKMNPKTQDQLREAWDALHYRVVLGEIPRAHYSGLQDLLGRIVVGHHMARRDENGLEIAFEFEADYLRFLEVFKHNQEQALKETSNG